MSRTDSEWIEILGADFNPDLPVDLQAAEYEADAAKLAKKAAPAPKNGSTVFKTENGGIGVHRQGYVTGADLELAIEFIMGEVADYAKSVQVALDKRDKRIEEIASDGFQGPWQENRSYARGMTVQAGGSVFRAKKLTAQRPGESADWVLMVRRGRNGRDARKP
jgi:hypothetical protein